MSRHRCAELFKPETCDQCSPRERNDLRGEKFTAPINRTKTYFVNRGSQEEPPLTPAEVAQRNLLLNCSMIFHSARYENSSCRRAWWNRDVCLDIDRAYGPAVGRSW